MSQRRRRAWSTAVLAASALACPIERGMDGATDAATGETEGETETGGMDDGACDEPGPAPAGPFAGRTTEELFLSDAEMMALCADIAGGSEGTFKLPDDYVFGDLHVYIEHPAEFDDGPLPDGQFPLLIFEHGTGQITGGYEHIWARIVPNGIVVANIDGPLGSSAGPRGARMACVARWFALEWEHSASLNCDLGIAGQSSGGEGAFLATRYLAEHPLTPEGMFLQRVSIGIAPRQADSDRYLSADFSVPLVVFQGSIDNDVPGGAIRNYDLMSPEEVGIEGSADKYVLWMYDVEHEAFGGGPFQDGDNVKVSQEEVYAEIPEAEAEKKGAALATEYMDAATGYFLLGRAADRRILIGSLRPLRPCSRTGRMYSQEILGVAVTPPKCFKLHGRPRTAMSFGM